MRKQKNKGDNFSGHGASPNMTSSVKPMSEVLFITSQTLLYTILVYIVLVHILIHTHNQQQLNEFETPVCQRKATIDIKIVKKKKKKKKNSYYSSTFCFVVLFFK
jgi:short subunit fatty acids transporter